VGGRRPAPLQPARRSLARPRRSERWHGDGDWHAANAAATATPGTPGATATRTKTVVQWDFDRNARANRHAAGRGRRL
jgi:hypothetical protein